MIEIMNVMSNANGAALKGIFLSYRRQDSASEAGRLYDNLTIRHPEWQVFLDIESILPGRDFLNEIDQFLARCGLVIAIIGSQWLSLKNSRGLRCIDDQMDTVRLELEHASKLSIPILPLLVSSAQMPRTEQLPEDLRWFTRLNALQLRHESFEQNLRSLLDATTRILSKSDREIEVERISSDRRSRTLRVKIRGDSHVIQFATRHNTKHVLTVAGERVPKELLRDFGTHLSLVQEYSFDLTSGLRTVPARLSVRYLSDLLWIKGMKLIVDNQTVYTEGKPL